MVQQLLTLYVEMECGQWSLELLKNVNVSYPENDFFTETCNKFTFESIATCDQKCKNGGTCYAPNLCKCPPEFKGDLCQYTADQCSPKRLNFNGLYTCKGYYDKLECELKCPGDFLPERKFAPKYTCMYMRGRFMPNKPPQCDYRGMNVEITHAE